MPSYKSNIKITIEANGEKFSINCRRMLDGKYSIKLGRSKSEKMPYATLTEVFEICRKWVVKKEKGKL